MRRLGVIGAVLVALLGGLGAAGYYMTHHVDWARVYYKRFKAADEFVFDKIAPHLKKTDPAKLIRIDSRVSAERIRRGLATAIWGPDGVPTGTLPASVSEDGIPKRLADIPGVAAARRLSVPIDLGYTAFVYLLSPAKANGRLVIYQNGYAGTVGDVAPVIAALIGAGYAVAAINYPGYGANQFPPRYLERFGWYELANDHVISVHPRPIRFYVEPVVVAVNHVLKEGDYQRVDMLGFSAGGWIATIAAAVDPRIRSTITVAGGYPLYLRLRNIAKESPPPQFFQPLLQAANYLEMYVLAAAGPGRELTQIFNRYDRCCYRNTFARLYEPAVRDKVAAAGAGAFRVLIDESHADHKISDWAVTRILDRLAAEK